MVVNRAAFADHVAIEVDGNDDSRAERPAYRDGYGIHEGAVDQPSAIHLDLAKEGGEREGPPERVHQVALVDPNLATGAELSRDGDEFALQLLNGELSQVGFQATVQALPGDQPRAGKIEVEKAEHATAGQGPGEFLELAQPPCDIAGPRHGADGRAGDDVRLQPGFGESLEHADMGPTAGRAAAKGDTYDRSRHATCPTLMPGDRSRRIGPKPIAKRVGPRPNVDRSPLRYHTSPE